MGSSDSVKLLEAVRGDLERLLAQERVAYLTRRGHPKAGEEKFTPSTCKRLLAYVSEDGLWLEQAADLCGVSRATVYDWRAKGRADPLGRFGQFAIDVAAARMGQVRALHNKAIEKAREGDGRLLLDLLERFDREHYGKRQTIEIDLESAKDNLLEQAAKILCRECLEKLIATLASGGAEAGTETAGA